MDECFVLTKENPKEQASFFSKLCFLWTTECALQSNRKEFRLEDTYKCVGSFNSNINGNRLEEKWKQELKACWKQNSKPSLLRVIVKVFYPEYFPLAISAFLNYVVIKGLQPLLLSNLIKLFIEKNYTPSEMIMNGGGLCLIILCSSFLLHHTVCGSNLLAIKIRVAVSSLVYRKVLKLSQLSLSATSSGHVINLLANDVGRFDNAIQAFHFLWMTPIQLTVIILVIWSLFGSVALVGIIILVCIMVPLQGFLGHLTGVYRKKAVAKTDTRVKLMNEIFVGMEVIKMYTWEKPFETLVHKTREEELHYIKRSSYIRGILACMMFVTERLGLCVTVVCFSLLGFPVSTDVVFSVSICFRVLQYSLGTMLPAAITIGSEVIISLRRLQEFLILEEKDQITSTISRTDNGEVDLREVSAYWREKKIALDNISMSIPSGCLCAVVGPVGSGKSSFLKLLLGEIPRTRGYISIGGTISFSPQKPWLFQSTIRKNIIFDLEFDENRYPRVIEACGLAKDLQQFQDGDQTVVGSRGVSLSGGQRARVSLARAVYRNADIYLLDDILSALDAKIGKYVFEECILKFLRGKTILFVTHQLHYLKDVEHIVILNKGFIEEQGTFKELFENESQHFLEDLKKGEEIRKKSQIGENKEFVIDGSNLEVEKTPVSNIDDINNFKGSVIWKYVKFSGSFTKVGLFLLFLLISQMSLNLSDYWVTLWSEDENLRHSHEIKPSLQHFKQNNSAIPSMKKRDGFALSYSTNGSILSQWTETVYVDCTEYILIKTSAMRTVYIIIILLSIIFMLLRSTLFFHLCIKASQKLHDKMFFSFLEAPMTFFYTTPPGNTLNRFSKDMAAADELFPKALINVLGSIPVLFGSMSLIVISNSFMMILIAPLWLILLKIRKWFLTTVKTLRRIETSVKSPIFSYVTSTIDGISTIRSTSCEELLIPQFDRHQDTHTASSYLAISCTSAFGLWLDLLCVFFVSSVILFFIVLDRYIYISGSFISLAIFHSMAMVGLFQFCIRTLSETVNHLTNIERILGYTQLEKKDDTKFNDGTLPRLWPVRGEIEFINLNLRYSDKDQLVLKDLSLKINGGEKIGIVGRTGAGKSSIISALFRLSPIEGTILIDGINIQSIELKRLRREIAIIPQEPLLFSASVRFNLDPFFEFPDERIWNVLNEIKLTEAIPSLDFELAEGGNNFSVGQRQLICLARAMLRENKILILDEATANVDTSTDQFIQNTIKKKFSTATVLTVAHRLISVMASDRVIVMEDGKVVEFGHPLELLREENGYFRQLAEETD